MSRRWAGWRGRSSESLSSAGRPVVFAVGAFVQAPCPLPMSHALLLRLFLSPSFFSVHVALQYLRIYADNIGITYYLTRRLRELDTQELREVWGFVW